MHPRNDARGARARVSCSVSSTYLVTSSAPAPAAFHRLSAISDEQRNKINCPLHRAGYFSEYATAHLCSGTWVETLLSNLYAGRFDLRNKLMITVTGLLNQTGRKRGKSRFGVVYSAKHSKHLLLPQLSGYLCKVGEKATAACMHPNSKALYNFAWVWAVLEVQNLLNSMQLFVGPNIGEVKKQRPCLVHPKIQNFFKIPCHIESYATCIEY
jgi:hypothetical protein